MINTFKKKTEDNFSYLGIDIVPVLIEKARELYPGEDIEFKCEDFLSSTFQKRFDYIIASGIFNFKLTSGENYSYISEIVNKAFDLSADGLAFDFLSDKVDFKHDHTFHSSPGEILDIAYKYSRNIILRNDYMPFEFSLFVFKDDSFDTSDTLFKRFKHS